MATYRFLTGQAEINDLNGRVPLGNGAGTAEKGILITQFRQPLQRLVVSFDRRTAHSGKLIVKIFEDLRRTRGEIASFMQNLVDMLALSWEVFKNISK